MLLLQGIRVNSINPGMVESDFFDNAGMVDNEEKKKGLLDESGKSYPLGRVGQPTGEAWSNDLRVFSTRW